MPFTISATGDKPSRLRKPPASEADELEQINVQLTKTQNWLVNRHCKNHKITKSAYLRQLVQADLDTTSEGGETNPVFRS